MARILLFKDERNFSVLEIPSTVGWIIEQIRLGAPVIPGLEDAGRFLVCRVGELLVVAPGPLIAGRNHQRIPRLTKREQEVLQGLADGRTAKEIALRLRLKPRTILAYIGSIKRKLHALTREQLVGRAVALGLCISWEDS